MWIVGFLFGWLVLVRRQSISGVHQFAVLSRLIKVMHVGGL